MKKTKMLLVASLLCGLTAAHADDNVVTATYGNAVGNTTRTMTVALNHEKDYVAFYLTMELPAGTTVDEVKVKSPLVNGGTVDLSTKGGSADESTNFHVEKLQVGTTCNFVGYNYGNEPIVGNSGEILFTVNLKTQEGINFDASTVKTKCTFVDVDSKEVALGEPVTDPRLWGDVIKDKTIDVSDYQAVANKIANKTVDQNADMFAADVVNDGNIDVSDYQAVANIIANKK